MFELLVEIYNFLKQRWEQVIKHPICYLWVKAAQHSCVPEVVYGHYWFHQHSLCELGIANVWNEQ